MRLSPGLHSSPRDLDNLHRLHVTSVGPQNQPISFNSSSRSNRFLRDTNYSHPCMTPSSTSSDQQRGMFRWFKRTWLRNSHSSTDADTAEPHSQGQTLQSASRAAAGARPPPTHLIVLVNGLFGSAANWDVIAEQLQQHLPPDTLLHPSQVNARCVTWGVTLTSGSSSGRAAGIVAQQQL
jgi:hypothetical protein